MSIFDIFKPKVEKVGLTKKEDKNMEEAISDAFNKDRQEPTEKNTFKEEIEEDEVPVEEVQTPKEFQTEIKFK